jgi:hypothetical protein
VGVWPVKRAIQSTFDCPYHQLDPTLAADTKLVWQQEVAPVGVPDDGLGSEPVDHVPDGNGAEATICLAQRCEPARAQHRLSRSRPSHDETRERVDSLEESGHRWQDGCSLVVDLLLEELFSGSACSHTGP